MPIITRENEYPGVNPHLNSHLQQPDGGWSAFHARFIGAIADTLDQILPAPYYAVEEQSLQIRIYGVQGDTAQSTRTTPDVTVYQTQPAPKLPVESQTPTMTFPVTETFIAEEDINAVVIYRMVAGRVPGEAITRIEVLSPGNKPPGSHHLAYLNKRQQTLQGGLRLVEIDILHESPPILTLLPDYTAQDANAYPYYIISSNPHPSPEASNSTQVYGFGVMQPVPVVPVPLADDNAIAVDLGLIYNEVFMRRRLFQQLADYSQEPVNMQRYSATDQAAIRQQMAMLADKIK